MKRASWLVAAAALGAVLYWLFEGMRRQREAERARRAGALVEEASMDSFPASDPPSFTGGHA